MVEALQTRFKVVLAGDGAEMDVATALSTYEPAIYVQPGTCSHEMYDT